MNFRRMASKIAVIDDYDSYWEESAGWADDEEWMDTVDTVWLMLEESRIDTDEELQDMFDTIEKHIGVEHLWDKWDFSFDARANYEFKGESYREEFLDGIRSNISKTERKPYSVWIKMDDGFFVLSGKDRDEAIKILMDTSNIKEFDLGNMMGAKGYKGPKL